VRSGHRLARSLAGWLDAAAGYASAFAHAARFGFVAGLADDFLNGE